MGTIRQKKLAREIVENLRRPKPKNKKELLVSSGYTEISASASPKFIMDQKGVKEELEALGFSEHQAKKVVAHIMNNEKAEPNSRLKAADMTFKVHGSYAPEKTTNLNLNVKANGMLPEGIRKLGEEYEGKLKEELMKRV